MYLLGILILLSAMHRSFNIIPKTPKKKSKYNKFDSEYRRIVSLPLVEGNMKIVIINIWGRKGSGKTTLENKIAEDIVHSHPGVDVMIRFSNSWAALFERVGEEGPISVITCDDPLKLYSSRYGGGKKKGEDIGDSEEIRHIAAKKRVKLRYEKQGLVPPAWDSAEMRSEEKKETGIIYMISGPQKIKYYEKMFRGADLHIFKSDMEEERDGLIEMLGGKKHYMYLTYLEVLSDFIFTQGKDEFRKYTVARTGNRIGLLELGLPVYEFDQDDRYFVGERGDKKSQQSIDSFDEAWNYASEILPELKDLYGPKNVQEYMVKYRLWRKHKDKKEEIKSMCSDITALVKGALEEYEREKDLGVVKEPETESIVDNITTEIETPKNIVPELHEEGDELYDFYLEYIRSNTEYWGSQEKCDDAASILEILMFQCWKLKKTLTQTEIAEAISTEHIVRSKQYVSELWKRTNTRQPTLQNRICGDGGKSGGGHAFESFSSEYKLPLEYPTLTFITEEGKNVHWPDITSNEGDIWSCKAMMDPNTNTVYFNFDKKSRPEVDACRLGGFYKNPNTKEEFIKTKEVFRILFCNLAWGSFILETEEIDPDEYKGIHINKDFTYELTPRNL